MSSLSVIVASGGRPSLVTTLGTVVPQLSVYDQLLLLVDQRAPYGHASRNRMIGWATGEYLAFVDDDEEWVPEAVETIRAAIGKHPDAGHLFEADGRSGMLVVVPNRPPLARFDGAADGLERFVAATARRWPVLNHPQVLVRHG